MSVLTDIGTYIVAQGLGTAKLSTAQPSATWLVYTAGQPPGDTSDAISLNSYAGGPPLEVMGSGSSGVVAVEARFQVTVRHMVYSTALAKAEAIWTALHNYVGTLSGVRYLRIECKEQPYPIGKDDATRWLVGFSCIATKERF